MGRGLGKITAIPIVRGLLEICRVQVSPRSRTIAHRLEKKGEGKRLCTVILYIKYGKLQKF